MGNYKKQGCDSRNVRFEILTPSFSLSISTFFMATNFLGLLLSRALNTSLWRQALSMAKSPRLDCNIPKSSLAYFANFLVFASFVAVRKRKVLYVFLLFSGAHPHDCGRRAVVLVGHTALHFGRCALPTKK